MDYGDESYASGEDSLEGLNDVQEGIIDGAPIDDGALQDFLERGRSIRAVLHPLSNNSLAWISANAIPKDKSLLAVAPFEKIEANLYQASQSYNGEFSTEKTDLTLRLSEIYEDVQVTYNDNPDADLIDMVVKASTSYIERLDELMVVLTGTLESRGLNDEDEQLRSTLIDSLIVWRCAQAIYLAPRDSLLCDGLMSWVNSYDPKPSDEEGQDIMTAKNPFQHPGFWDYLSKGIVRGLFEMVSSCLSSSGLSNVDAATNRAIHDLCLLLKTYPRTSQYLGKPADFRDRHRIWRAKAAKAAKEIHIPDPEISSAFRQLYELLKGDKDALYRQCETWQECLAALALLYDPAGVRKPGDVRALFELITESDDFGLAIDRTWAPEDACAAFCSGNIPKATAKAGEVDLSSAAHLADLLEKVEILDDIRNGDLDLTLRDVLVLELGDFCLSQPGSWRAALTYWRTVGDVGIDSIQQVITRIPLSSQVDVDEILTVCNDLELRHEASQIETVWARKLALTGKLYQALVTYDRAENPLMIDTMNWRLFRDSLLVGHATAQDEELEAALQTPETTSSTTISVLLAPYATLMTLYTLKASNEAPEAALHLSALLKSPDVPKEYMSILMAEMLPFLEPTVDAFTLRDIYDMLAAIEDFYDSKQFSQGLELLTSSMQVPSTSTEIPDWRTCITPKFDARDVLALVRLRVAKAIAHKFCKS
ncbi:Nucleoporin nup85 [Taphrina deformans PYCC 5710]|uniref:Nuclear pore complex protein Nup85 n=1 Tax=Taphrina deformans (strain PYCC 5710 / ATCC 11124 / CBS 356.35 / IMI 108563 / JCM 9778 / NBRC 8474) TaxID=1097556 RepID=R4XE49_TAPDE|nr:Nucleoporin nup85 [Taphrina deformans PYCC 5710]|eukprot:CCG82715.1 Nucleoporin nup85 [Taphrina deformans PYCC 5710]